MAQAFSVSDILGFSGGRLVNEADVQVASIQVERPATLGASRPSEIAFFFSKAYQAELMTANPGILITGEDFVAPLKAAGLPLWKKTAVIACADPYLAMAVLSERFAERLSSIAHTQTSKVPEIHATAVVHPLAEIGPSVSIGAFAVIEAEAKIGSGTVIYPHCYVGPKAVIGDQCVLFSGVKVYEWTVIGNKVRIHAGSVLGSDGFGYAPRKAGGQMAGHQKIYHLGRVVVGDGSEIGANCTLDRSTFGETKIGAGVKLDNLVHIGHNAEVGEGTVIAGGTCLAGGVKLGKYVVCGGLTGIANRVDIGDGASIGALALVTKDIPAGGTAVGNPQREYSEHFRAHAMMSKLVKKGRSKRE
jgi:UDP-3-O-[3-hydroxymyristoyl] glucosamine N-acyltransferase